MSSHKKRKAGRRTRARRRSDYKKLKDHIIELGAQYPDFKVTKRNKRILIRPITTKKGKTGKRIYMDVGIIPGKSLWLSFSDPEQGDEGVIYYPPSKPALARTVRYWLEENSFSKNNPSQSEITASLLFAWGLGYIVGKGRR